MIQRTTFRIVSGILVTLTAGTIATAESKPKTFDALRSEVQALKVKKVAWRKIPWKTCLLDGIKASREQKKPMMLWVFIDRPIDDERC